MLAASAVALSAQAVADPDMSGHYIATNTRPDGPTENNDLYFSPCGDGCADVSHTAGGPSHTQARLINGQWTMDDPAGEVACEDGSKVPDALAAHSVWDPITLQGTVQITAKVPECGNPVGTVETDSLQLSQAP